MNKFFETGNGVLYQGDSIAVLKTLPENSVHCCVTSPPYWGLRSYKTDPQIWGGEPDCRHEWEKTPPRRQRAESDIKDSESKQVTNPASVFNSEEVSGRLCRKCGAWLGELGLEPTPDLFVEHLTAVFREVRRVLRNDGTLWLNLGDSYFSNTKGSGGQSNKQDRNAGSRYETRRFERNGLKNKDLCMIPARVALALQADGWYLRSEIIWAKPNPMPESVRDRPTKSHEMVYLLTKSPKYYYDYQAILEPATGFDGRKDTMMKGSTKYKNGFAPDGVKTQTLAAKGHARWSNKIYGRTEKKMEGTGYGGDGKGLHGHSGYLDADGNLRTHTDADGLPARNKRSVWTVATHPFSEAHFATFPKKLIEPMIKAGCPTGGTVLDPFGGSGTVAAVCENLDRRWILAELNPEYCAIAERRIRKAAQRHRQLCFESLGN